MDNARTISASPRPVQRSQRTFCIVRALHRLLQRARGEIGELHRSQPWLHYFLTVDLMKVWGDCNGEARTKRARPGSSFSQGCDLPPIFEFAARVPLGQLHLGRQWTLEAVEVRLRVRTPRAPQVKGSTTALPSRGLICIPHGPGAEGCRQLRKPPRGARPGTLEVSNIEISRAARRIGRAEPQCLRDVTQRCLSSLGSRQTVTVAGKRRGDESMGRAQSLDWTGWR